VRIRSRILQQLKDLKALKEDAVLRDNEFSVTKGKTFERIKFFVTDPY